MAFDEHGVRKMYDRFSALPLFWELDAWTCRATESSPYRARAVELLDLEPGASVLDVACGTGLNFRRLQERIGPEGRLVGVDLSPRTLELARRRCRKRGWDNVELVEHSASTFQTEERFDAAICSFAIEIVPEWKPALARTLEAVVPGGRLAIVGFRDSDRRGWRLFNPLWRAMGPAFGGVMTGRDVPGHLRERTREIAFEPCFGGFYYVMACEVPPDPDSGS